MSDGGSELQRWSRVLAVAKQQGRDDLVKTAQDALDEINQRETAKDLDPGALASFAEGAASGASFGLGPIAARGLDKLLGRTDARQFQEAAERQHPIASTAGAIAGSLAVPIPGGFAKGLAKPGVTALERAGIGGLIGAAQGGLSGLSTADPNARARQALIQASLGGALGAVGMARAGRSAQRSIESAQQYAERAARLERDLAYARRAERQMGELAPAARAAETTGATAEELAVAKRLGIPVELVRGKVGQQAVTGGAESHAAQARPENTPLQTVTLPRRGLLEQLRIRAPRTGQTRVLTEAEQRAARRARLPELPTYQRRGKLTPPSELSGHVQALREGESLERIGEHGYAVHGERATPTVERGPTLAELSGPGELPPRATPKVGLPPEVEETIAQSRAQRVAKSYAELRKMPPEERATAKIDYFTRGGKLEQAVSPEPAMTGKLAGSRSFTPPASAGAWTMAQWQDFVRHASPRQVATVLQSGRAPQWVLRQLQEGAAVP